MNKQELIEAVHAKVNEQRAITKVTAEAVVNAVFDTLTHALADGKEARVSGFGSFRHKFVKERLGRNPNNGNTITVPAHNEVRFKPSQPLKDAVNA